MGAEFINLGDWGNVDKVSKALNDLAERYYGFQYVDMHYEKFSGQHYCTTIIYSYDVDTWEQPTK